MQGAPALNDALALEALDLLALGRTVASVAREFSTRLGQPVHNQALHQYLARNQARLAALTTARQSAFPAPVRRAWTTAPRLAGSWLIGSDVQCPSHDAEFIKQVCEVAFSWGVGNLLLNGDLINLDGASVFEPAPEESSISEELQCSRDVSGWFEDAFPGLKVFTSGNHDRRLGRALKNRLTFEDACRLILRNADRWQVHLYPWSWVGPDWLIAHPAGTSVIPGRYAQFVAEKYHAHTILAHGHTFGASYAKNGKRAIDSGGMFDPQRLTYAALSIKNRPFMQQGAVLLVERLDAPGVHHPYCLTSDSDWRALRRLYRPGELAVQAVDAGAAAS